MNNLNAIANGDKTHNGVVRFECFNYRTIAWNPLCRPTVALLRRLWRYTETQPLWDL